jgi:hypothetical protein
MGECFLSPGFVVLGRSANAAFAGAFGKTSPLDQVLVKNEIICPNTTSKHGLKTTSSESALYSLVAKPNSP